MNENGRICDPKDLFAFVMPVKGSCIPLHNRWTESCRRMLVDLLQPGLRTVLSRVKRGPSGFREQLLVSGVGVNVALAINTGATLATAVLLARWLGADAYGAYAFSLSVVSIVSLPLQAGIPTLLVREIAAYQARSDWGHLRGVLAWSDRVVATLTLVSVIPLAFLLLGWIDLGDPTRERAVTWAWILIPLLALANLRAASLRGLRWVVVGQLPDLVVRPVVLLLLISFLVILITSGSLEYAIVACIVASLVGILSGSILLRRALPSEARTARACFSAARWRTSLIPLSVLSGIQIVNGQLDLLMLGAFGSNVDVAVYRVAFQGAALVTLVATAATSILMPHVARLHARGEKESLQRLVTRATKFMVAGSLPICAAIMIFGDSILKHLFGSEYLAANTALRVLCIGNVFGLALGPTIVIANMTNNERYTVAAALFALIFHFIASLLLVPRFSFDGAAVATASSLLVLRGVLAFFLFRKTGVATGIALRSSRRGGQE